MNLLIIQIFLSTKVKLPYYDMQLPILELFINLVCLKIPVIIIGEV